YPKGPKKSSRKIFTLPIRTISTSSVLCLRELYASFGAHIKVAVSHGGQRGAAFGSNGPIAGASRFLKTFSVHDAQPTPGVVDETRVLQPSSGYGDRFPATT